MLDAKLMNQCSPPGSASPTSTQRVAKWRERRRRGVLYVGTIEVLDRDLRLLKTAGYLASDDPKAVSRAEFENALGSLLDGLAKRFGVFGAGSDTPVKTSAQPIDSITLRAVAEVAGFEWRNPRPGASACYRYRHADNQFQSGVSFWSG